jgi:predicted nucleotidyltransferase
MSRDQLIAMLRARYPEMCDRFGVASLWIFGSASRDELGEDSDVDLMVSFNGRATFDRYFGLKLYLEELLGRPVDLATERMLKPRLRRRIESELLRVA